MTRQRLWVRVTLIQGFGFWFRVIGYLLRRVDVYLNVAFGLKGAGEACYDEVSNIWQALGDVDASERSAHSVVHVTRKCKACGKEPIAGRFQLRKSAYKPRFHELD